MLDHELRGGQPLTYIPFPKRYSAICPRISRAVDFPQRFAELAADRALKERRVEVVEHQGELAGWNHKLRQVMRRVLRLAQPFQHRMTDNEVESLPELETLDLRV